MSYQLTKALPYFIKRWVLFDKSAKLEPLYQFDRSLKTEDVVSEKSSVSDEKK